MWRAAAIVTLCLAFTPAAGGSTPPPEPGTASCLMEYRDQLPEPSASEPTADPSLLRRLTSYMELALKHRLSGLASYYASFFDGRKTANGEVFRNRKYSAAHLTLPLGTWVEVKSRATGRKLRLRVNDRGPYAHKFMLDLSQAAARYLGVDVARDRYVEVRVIALPGEEPLPEGLEIAPAAVAAAK